MAYFPWALAQSQVYQPTPSNTVAKKRAVAYTLHRGQSSLAQSSPRPDSLGNFIWIQFHLWPPSRQLEPRLHKRPSFTLNVRTPSSPDPYYHMNGAENGTGSKEGDTGVSGSRQNGSFLKRLVYLSHSLRVGNVSSCHSETDIHIQMSHKEDNIAVQCLWALKSNLQTYRVVTFPEAEHA